MKVVCSPLIILIIICDFCDSIENDIYDFDSPDIEFQSCSSTTNLNQCLRQLIQNLLPQLNNGSGILNMPPLDPFLVPRNRYKLKSGGFYATLIPENVRIFGISKTIIRDNLTVHITDKDIQIEFDTFNSDLFIEGYYKADIKVNDFKLRPKGFYNITIGDMKSSPKILGNFIEIGGDKHLRIHEFNLIPSIGNLSFYVSGIFPDQKENDAIVAFMNQYWRDMHKILLEDSRFVWEPILLATVNQFLSFVPFKDIISGIF